MRETLRNLTLATVTVVAGGVAAQPALATPAEARAKAALALSLARQSAESQAPLTYADAAGRAMREGKPLVVWVGVSNPAVEAQLTGCVHCYADAFPGAEPPVGVPSVLVAVHNGSFFERRDLPPTATKADILAAVGRPVTRQSTPTATPAFVSPFSPLCPDGRCPNRR